MDMSIRAGRPDSVPGSPSFSLAVVIPAYNEQASIEKTLDSIYEQCSALTETFEVLVYDDGSRDNTLAILHSCQERYQNLHVFSDKRNRGVAEALKYLYTHSQATWTAFLPADGQVPASELPKLLACRPTAMIYGRRTPRLDPPGRLLASWGFNFLVRCLWGIPIYDVDSVTLFHRQALDIKFCSKDLCLQVEILIKGLCKGLNYVETPVLHQARGGGKAWGANPRVALRTIASLVWARICPSYWGR